MKILNLILYMLKLFINCNENIKFDIIHVENINLILYMLKLFINCNKNINLICIILNLSKVIKI